jgi:hypothetical protein
MFRIRSSAVLALALALSAGSAAAQDAAAGPRRAENTFFVELGGNAAIYSLNYERFFTPKLGVRVGGMYLRADDDEGADIGVGLFPVMATYLLGEGNGHFEVGAGIGIATAGVSDADLGDDWGGSDVYGTATFGYRYQKPEGGVMFRAGFTPAIASGTVIPWAGVSVGYAF